MVTPSPLSAQTPDSSQVGAGTQSASVKARISTTGRAQPLVPGPIRGPDPVFHHQREPGACAGAKGLDDGPGAVRGFVVRDDDLVAVGRIRLAEEGLQARPGTPDGPAGPAPRPIRAGRGAPVQSSAIPYHEAESDAGELRCDGLTPGGEASAFAVQPSSRRAAKYRRTYAWRSGLSELHRQQPASSCAMSCVGSNRNGASPEMTVAGAAILEPPVPEMEHVPLQAADPTVDREVKPVRPPAVARLLRRIHGVRADHGIGSPEHGADDGAIATPDDAGIVEPVPLEHLAPVGPAEAVDGHPRADAGSGLSRGPSGDPPRWRQTTRGRLLGEDHHLPRCSGARAPTRASEMVDAREQLDGR